MKILSVFALCTTAAVLAGEPAKPEAVPADIAAAAKDYLTYRKMLPAPKSIGAQFSVLCGVNPDMEALKKKNGPHALRYVQHYRNPIAAASTDAKAWPVGSVLMKEKLLPTYGDKSGKLELLGVAGMIKRAAGTHPKSGDWEFFWVEEGKASTEAMASCAGCHSGAAKDYVFTSFPEAKPK